MSLFQITLKYEGKTYQYKQDITAPTNDYAFDIAMLTAGVNAGDPMALARYVYEHPQGWYSCDCNRALSIRLECDKEFPIMTCGNTIELVRIEEVKA